MTYAVSDIHGCYDKYRENQDNMLDLTLSEYLMTLLKQRNLRRSAVVRDSGDHLSRASKVGKPLSCSRLSVSQMSFPWLTANRMINENKPSYAAHVQHREVCSIQRRIYIYSHHSCALFTCDFQRNRVEKNNLSPQLPGIPNGCCCPAPPLSIVDSQQHPSSFHQPMIPVKHTPLVILLAHILHSHRHGAGTRCVSLKAKLTE